MAAAVPPAAAKEELADLIQRFMESLAWISDRLPFPVDRQKLRSMTTLAAVCVTIVFAWKFLRAPVDHQRRQQRRTGSLPGHSGARLQLNTNIPSSENFPSSSDSITQDAVDEFFQPVKLTQGQFVRHKLRDGRKVTSSLLGVILEETTPEELQKHATVRSSVLGTLLEVTKSCDVYLMERILDDESGERVLSALKDAGLFTTGGLYSDKVLFCSTENGRSSFVRQLEPDWHIDTNPQIIYQLADKGFHCAKCFEEMNGNPPKRRKKVKLLHIPPPKRRKKGKGKRKTTATSRERFIKYQLHISQNRPDHTASNVFSSPSLEQFFRGPE